MGGVNSRLFLMVAIAVVVLGNIFWSWRVRLVPWNWRMAVTEYVEDVWNTTGLELNGDETSTTTSTSAIVATNTTTTNNHDHHRRRQLPTFDNGGVIVFYHVFKTGGSTVRSLVDSIGRRRGRKKKKRVTGFRSSKQLHHDIETSIEMAKTSNVIRFHELHIQHPAPQFPTLLELSTNHISHWRTLAQQHGVDLFAFTLVREPTSFALSFFNYFHVHDNHMFEWNPYDQLQPTEPNFQQSLVPNRQCLLLALQPMGFYSPNPHLPDRISHHTSLCNHTTMHQLEHVLLHDMDWVGTTERLTQITLPLLRRMLVPINHSAVVPLPQPQKDSDQRGANHKLYLDQLSNRTRQLIRDHSQLDQALYERIQEQYHEHYFGDLQQPST